MLKKLRDMGMTSDMAYMAGFCSIGMTVMAWLASKKAEDKARADRWGLFVGEWAPTFFALGTALWLDERSETLGKHKGK
ncbi:hypothetical protein [Streptomonospora litoralis]|uniref:Uncharacterized protein n=1 Tax=Streptomonospora litoralis TaxID=2498135 RepID=A0A4V0ZJN7_9ACTN|nr:hypothetical protein [Streptomonospora litoralis]QBI54122.1 hypothetical protein EKD16_11695 [Streptomonospora litoralis]